MPLNNTIILPEDINQAKIAFDNALQLDKITVIVFGDNVKSNQAVVIADVLANVSPAGFERQVIWMKDGGHWATLKSSLSDGTVSIHTIQPDQSISLSITLSRKAEYVLSMDKIPDNVAMTLAFIKSSKA